MQIHLNDDAQIQVFAHFRSMAEGAYMELFALDLDTLPRVDIVRIKGDWHLRAFEGAEVLMDINISERHRIDDQLATDERRERSWYEGESDDL